MRVVSRAWLIGVMAMFAWTAHAQTTVPAARDLHADARAAARTGMPILLFFAADSCPYCQVVEESYLQPMIRTGEYAGRVLFRVIHVDDDAALRDFDGRMTTHRAFARAHRVSLTPVVRLMNADGHQLVPQLLGYTSPDFYGSYLESAIDNAIAKARTQSAAKE